MTFSIWIPFVKRVLLLSGLFFIITPVVAQFMHRHDFDLDLYGKGARAMGMAYAFNAVADDATALSWNPAGIAQIKKPELAFSSSLKDTEYRHASYEYDFRPVHTVDFLGFVYPIKLKKKNLAFGISYQNKMNFKFNYENLPNEYSSQHGKNTITVNTASLSCAYSFNRFINVGISYNRWFSLGNKSETYELNYLKKIFWREPENYPDEYIYMRTENHKYSANNLTAAILIDFSPWHFPLRYALKYDSKMWLTNDNDFTGHKEYIFYNDADTTWINFLQSVNKYEYPGIITNGLAFRFRDYLTITCDFDIHLFHDNIETWDFAHTKSYVTDDKRTIYVDSSGYIESTFIYSYIAFNQIRLGLEYVFHPEFGFIPVRAGWKTNHDELHTYDENKNAIKRVSAHSINFGTGITLKHFSIDIAYEAFWFQRRDENYEIEKRTDHAFALSAIWYIK
ncbi:MAG: outer membrane protein transport protein [Bacteroidales bacterium]|nr:outer membrane protein transport protein [Bacteroidales bacterium]MBN2762125.1 outer membrane protein transport protein [Bacteroidales bacterium]